MHPRVTVDVSPSSTTTYYANASSLAGCISDLDSITVNVNQLPVISLVDSNYVCVGLTEDLTPQISGNGGINILGALVKAPKTLLFLMLQHHIQ